MADFHGTQEVVTDLREDGVLIMRINRPEKRNAINGATSATMEDIMNLSLIHICRKARRC